MPIKYVATLGAVAGIPQMVNVITIRLERPQPVIIPMARPEPVVITVDPPITSIHER